MTSDGLGMLWLDPSGDDIRTKIKRAADFYEKKYGSRPNLCYVNPQDFPVDERNGVILSGFFVDQVEVRRFKAIQKQHFWLGMKAKDLEL